jgi:hypothetical protein
MNLYYAMGGGLGHLTRASAFLNQFGLAANSAILTSSDFASDKRICPDIKIIKVNPELARKPELYREFLKKTFSQYPIDSIYLDSFPFGLIGEFRRFDFGGMKVNYIARLLNWENYSVIFSPGDSIKLENCFLLEELETAHQNFIDANSFEQIKIGLTYPKPKLSGQTKQFFNEIKQKKPFWLIVHSGNKDEVSELVYYADEQRKIENKTVELLLISPQNLALKVSSYSLYNFYPANILFPLAERIFTGCGFNIMEQTAEFRAKHQFIPFLRRYDQQHLRAERSRRMMI